ncbi:hypothetical protein D3C74_336010 [compost metagenome]
MGRVNVTDFHAGAFPSQTTRTQCGQTAFVSQLSKRVRLVHELRQLRAAEELFNRCDDRTNVDQSLRRDHISVLNRHSFAHDAFHPGQANAELVLQELTDRTQTAVAKMVDIVRAADAVQ